MDIRPGLLRYAYVINNSKYLIDKPPLFLTRWLVVIKYYKNYLSGIERS